MGVRVQLRSPHGSSLPLGQQLCGKQQSQTVRRLFVLGIKRNILYSLLLLDQDFVDVH